MKKCLSGLFCLAVLLLFIVVSCDNWRGQSRGALMQQCYPDGTCDYGLECDLVNNVCYEPSHSGTDSGNTDGGSRPVENVPDGVSNFLNEDDIRALESVGMKIYRGFNPPNIEGKYYLDTLQVYYDDLGYYDLQFDDYVYEFYGQTPSLSLRTSYEAQTVSDVATGIGSFISGNGNCFSVYMDITGVAEGCSYSAPQIISGCVSSSGITGYMIGFIMKKKSGSNCDMLVEVSHKRIVIENDNLAERVGGSGGGDTGGCTSRYETGCYGGDVWWYDSCGNRETRKESCHHGCSNGQCESQSCTSRYETGCYGGDVWWYDSCGERETLKESCSHGCSNGQCEKDNFPHYHAGFWWSDKASYRMNWWNAREYCENLGGRLPTIGELRTLIQNCPDTETGGACGVTDSCLYWNDCWHRDFCNGCPSDYNSGIYSVFGDTWWLYSGSVVASQSWLVDFRSSGFSKSYTSFDNVQGGVRCLR